MLKKMVMAAAVAAAMSSIPATAATYYLTQSNTTPPFPDGTQTYATVDITEVGVGTGVWQFVVDALTPPLIAGDNFGIISFGFNSTLGNVTEGTLPTNWTFGSGNMDGFGDFEYVVAVGAQGSRQDPLTFTVNGPLTAGWWEEAAKKSNGGVPDQGSFFFSVHIGGFGGVQDPPGSAFFGGSDTSRPPNEVPIPAAAWLLGSGLLAMGAIGRRRMKGAA